ncbi:Phage integrase [Cupriavidus necator]|uniref:Phage integrase n=1 Tax=Cupriavidus necator TaxID=106590 RepID=A0A1K0IN44_CUPNE|nr:Phage integrase [Cupriavidus necator]
MPRRLHTPHGLPDAAALAALRAWYEGASSRQAAERYLPDQLTDGKSARSVIGRIRRQLAIYARHRQRPDLAVLFECEADQRIHHAKAIAQAVEVLRTSPDPVPRIGDDIALWLSERAVRALYAADLRTLADLTVRIPRRRQWWTAIPGLGPAGARKIEAFFARHPALTERARALIVAQRPSIVTPWEQLQLPHDVDGSAGAFRAPASTCILGADNDYDAIQAWLALHESPATQRAYRKEAERLILWAIVVRGKALSSLTTKDATDYRGFLRKPTPRERWVGPPRPRTAPDWRPFVDNLSPRSVAHALAVLSAMFRWLIEQRYVVANPFAGVKVRGSQRAMAMETTHAFPEGEWLLVRAIANGLEWSYGWQTLAAQRLRFLLDFGYATGLRISELANAALRNIEVDAAGDHWLHLIGKGGKPARVTLTPLARVALDRYLQERGLPVSRTRWDPSTTLIGSLDGTDAGITPLRLWEVMRRFFTLAADIIGDDHPALAEKLRRATPHWMRHTHATHALAKGVELSAVRDNLRHASISTTSIYLHTDDVKRARQFGQAFTA